MGAPRRPHGCCSAVSPPPHPRGASGPPHCEHRGDGDPTSPGGGPAAGGAVVAAAPQWGLGSPPGVQRCGEPPACSAPPSPYPPPPFFSLLTLRLQEEPKLPNLLPWQLCFASLNDEGGTPPNSVPTMGGTAPPPLWGWIWGGSTASTLGWGEGGQVPSPCCGAGEWGGPQEGTGCAPPLPPGQRLPGRPWGGSAGAELAPRPWGDTAVITPFTLPAPPA